MTGERGQRGVEVGDERVGSAREAADQHARLDDEAVDAPAGLLEHAEHRVGVEAVDAEGELGERLGVEPDAVVLAQPPQQLGVHHRGVVELELVVVVPGAAGPDGAAPQQHRSERPLLRVPGGDPGGDAGGEQPGPDATVRGQLPGHRPE